MQQEIEGIKRPNGRIIPKRGKGKHLVQYGMADLFRHYRKFGRDKSVKEMDISGKVYRGMTSDYLKSTIKEVLNGKVFVLPYSNGEIFIGKRYLSLIDYHGKAPLKFDYGTWNKTGLKTFHLNFQTNQFHYKYTWKKSISALGSKYYRFYVSRANKENLSRKLKKQGNFDCYIVPWKT